MTNKTFPDFADASSLTAAYTTLVWNGTSNKEVALSVLADWAKKRFSYQLSPTVGANNLTLALLTSEGNTPTAAEPIYLLIGNTIRTVSAATTCTLAAGTNWFNSGGAELATKEIDYFAYAVWDSNSSVVAIAPARTPNGTLVSSFSATTTNEKHLGNYANFTSTDSVVTLGRFAATLSAGAGYTWSVPTFTNNNLVHEPCMETRLLSWTPTHARSGGAYSNAPTVSNAHYQIDGNRMLVYERHTQNAVPGSSGNQTMTIPFTNTLGVTQDMEVMNGTTVVMLKAALSNSSATVTIYKYDGTEEATASNVYRVQGWIFI